MLGFPPFAFKQDMARKARAAHAIGMADRDGTAIDVELLRIDAEPVPAIEHLYGKRLVQLPKVDVVDLEAEALEQTRHGENGPNTHFVRLAARRRQSFENAKRLQTPLFGKL